MFATRPARRTRTAATRPATFVGVVAATVILTVAPVQADTRSFTDESGDMTSGQQVHPGDIEKVTVTHEHRLRVIVRHHDLQRDVQIGARLLIDTNTDRPGPELVLTGGLFEGTDYSLTRVRNWKPVGKHLTCSHRLGLDYAKDRSRFVVGRGCLGDTDNVGVALRVSGPSGKSVDWLKWKRTFTPNIAR